MIATMHSAILCIAMLMRLFPASGDQVNVEFLVRVPPNTPAADTIHLSGNLPELGNWSGGRLRLKRSAEDGRYHGQLTVPRGTKIEYKVTRGSWATVEKGPHGEE